MTNIKLPHHIKRLISKLEDKIYLAEFNYIDTIQERFCLLEYDDSWIGLWRTTHIHTIAQFSHPNHYKTYLKHKNKINKYLTLT